MALLSQCCPEACRAISEQLASDSRWTCNGFTIDVSEVNGTYIVRIFQDGSQFLTIRGVPMGPLCAADPATVRCVVEAMVKWCQDGMPEISHDYSTLCGEGRSSETQTP
jgi:hypothetical protein